MTQRQLLTTLLKFLGAACIVHGTLWFLAIIFARLAQAAVNVGGAQGIVAVVPLAEVIVGILMWAKNKLDDEG